MIEYQPVLDLVFHALADPTRRAMLDMLAMGERNVGELAAPFAMSLAAASKHVRTLERAGLVRRTVRGRTHLCTIDPAPLAEAAAWLRGYAHPAPASEAIEVVETSRHVNEEEGGGAGR